MPFLHQNLSRHIVIRSDYGLYEYGLSIENRLMSKVIIFGAKDFAELAFLS